MLYVFITSRIQKLCGIIHAANTTLPNHGQIAISAMVYSSPQQTYAAPVAYPARRAGAWLHGKAIDGVLNFHRRVMVKVTKPPPRNGAAPCSQNSQFIVSYALPDPAAGSSQISPPDKADRSRLKHADRRIMRMIAQRRIFEFGFTSTKPLEN